MTWGRKQRQEAGDGAQQWQVAGNVIVGINEERAREIAEVTAKQVIAEHAGVALAIVQERIDEFDRRVISSLEARGHLDAFGDPAFQRAYRKAQTGAASSDRATDYDTLAALLSDRAESVGDRVAVGAIEKAIEVVDLVDDLALRGMSLMYAIREWHPFSYDIDEGLDVIDRMMGVLITGPLPHGSEWVMHLESLGLVRATTVMELKKMPLLLSEKLVGYVAPGVESRAMPEQVHPAVPGVRWEPLTVEHALKPGYRRVRASNEAMLSRVFEQNGFPQHWREIIMAEARSLFGLGTIDPSLREPLLAAAQERTHLAQAMIFWDSIPLGAHLTLTGETLAKANAYRLDTEGYITRE
ncbi:LPO_1073/Vpar_1526 family protein [Microbacterium sp. SA39]|uniref:LPO_1073/Vpar_1526 family protein n=1 Tax=Microbacterium sp. SA39 TaxID=1263625 RepID=UPI0005FA7DCC|nr:LPO_1073/Vpar_1526 family protein [Microbacterium sp. SA39]KJQ55729.1 hypothetical protein RS85_00431 [Microbacterium sp. SA39]